MLEKYPHGNTLDNSYNWIAWSYLRDYQCQEALKTYQQIQQKFPLTRFSRYAATAIEKIEEFSASPYQAGERVLVKHEAPWLGFIYGEPTASDIGDDGYWRLIPMQLKFQQL